MIGPKIVNRSTQIRSFNLFCPEYKAVLNKGLSLGVALPTYSQQVKQNKLLLQLKAAGVWALLDSFFCFANNGSQGFALINWKNPASIATLVNAPAFTINQGFNSDGLTSYIDTNYNAATQGINFQNNSAGVFAYQIGAAFGCLSGTSGGPGDGLLIANSTGQRLNMFATNLNAAADMTGNGFKAINRTSSTDVVLYNETTLINRTTTAAARINANRRILNGQGSFLSSLGKVYFYAAGGNMAAVNMQTRTILINYINSL